MDKTIFAFIWKHSKRQQMVLLGVTLLSFPLIFASLELPKQIINGAIGAESDTVTALGIEFTQVQYLLVLCGLFLAAVIGAGLVKMRINTMKGQLSERMLRRFRYQLISRMMRFPKPYFRDTSQGELVSMITSEAEPMGGLMGDAVAQPVFVAGQMLTILGFLFLQSPWFGMAAVAFIPLQGWLIPKLQREINQLNKKRVIEIRALSSEIGETAAGMSELRANGGWRYRRALFTDRLGRLFWIRFEIYQKKFFMKFLNNFINQLTPFFFYSIGGYLAIKGQVSIGALVAALAAYKDIAGPWKELLTFYNQTQDMAVRWDTVIERFAPRHILDDKLIDGAPDEIPHLRGDITLKDVSLRDGDGNLVLEDLNVTLPKAGRIAVRTSNQIEREAFAELLLREVVPTRGSITVGDYDLAQLHQGVIAARIGYAHGAPHLFKGTLGDNVLMPLRSAPPVDVDDREKDADWREARWAGNSLDRLDVEWSDPKVADLENHPEVMKWWFDLVQAMGMEKVIYRQSLQSKIDPVLRPSLARRVIELRPEIKRRIEEAGLSQFVNEFAEDRFNPGLPLGGNLIYTVPKRRITQDELAREDGFFGILRDVGFEDDSIDLAVYVLDRLNRTFGRDGTHHPLFQRLGIEPELYDKLIEIFRKYRDEGADAIDSDERTLMLTVPFTFSAEQIGEGLDDDFKERVLEIRRTYGEDIRKRAEHLFVKISPKAYLTRMTIVENALFGTISSVAGNKTEWINDLVGEVLAEHDLMQPVAELVFDVEVGIGGNNLPATIRERAGFNRATIKRPDILILDNALRSLDTKTRALVRARLSELLPDTTMIFIEKEFRSPEDYDLVLDLKNGRIDGKELPAQEDDTLRRYRRIIAQTELFSGLSTRNQRLLAFNAQQMPVEKGHCIFRTGEEPDAAYLCISGQAELRFKNLSDDAPPITVVEPGRLIGDLNIFTGEPRQLDLFASADDTVFLRIGAQELLSVVSSDAEVAFSMLQTVSRNLTGAADRIRESRLREFGGSDA